jgi:hypothetical protein
MTQRGTAVSCSIRRISSPRSTLFLRPRFLPPTHKTKPFGKSTKQDTARLTYKRYSQNWLAIEPQPNQSSEETPIVGQMPKEDTSIHPVSSPPSSTMMRKKPAAWRASCMVLWCGPLITDVGGASNSCRWRSRRARRPCLLSKTG